MLAAGDRGQVLVGAEDRQALGIEERLAVARCSGTQAGWPTAKLAALRGAAARDRQASFSLMRADLPERSRR